MDRLHLIKVFVAVVEAGGFAGAARKLNISPPAITRAIGELESHLGVRLLSRTTRVVRVTDAGERYVEDCKRILVDLAEADESVSGLHSSPRGRLVVTAPVLFGALHVTPVVTECLDRHPDVSIACWFMDRVVNMMDEGVDVAIRIGDLADSSMQAIRVGSVRRVVCAAPSYLARRGMPVIPDDLHAHTIISADEVTRGSEWRLVEDGEPKILKVQARMVTTTNDSAVAATVSGFGISRLMSYQVANHVRSGRLKIVLSEFETGPLPVHVLHREGRHASRKARAFLDLAIDRLRSNASLNELDALAAMSDQLEITSAA